MLEMNRFIVGRPNPIRLPVVPEGVELSDAMNSGHYFEQKVWQIDLWTYIDNYPPVLKLDFWYMTPNNPLRIGDIPKFLPNGMYLHKKYNHQLFHSIAKMTKTADAHYIEKKNKEYDEDEAEYWKS
mgnify:CR=1 FL=1